MKAESKNHEFKREYVEDIKKTVIAFANTDGGELLIGVDDDGKQIISVNVQRGTSRPYYLAGKGIRPEGVFLRHGASTVPASEAAILAMIKETSSDRYELARSLNQQLTFEHAKTAFIKKDVNFGEPQKRTLHLISEDGTFANLALLLSEQCPHTIKLAVFDGTSKTTFKDRREFGGSLFQQLEDVYAFIDRHNNLRSEFNGLDRIDKRDYPIVAVREALLNALVHRDYGLSPASLISIFDDRIEIVTIGGLVKGLSLNDIMLGVSALRNPYLADIFYRLNLIEAYGTGMPKITDSYKNHTVQPTIELSDNAFKITLPNTNYKIENTLPLDVRERQVLNLFENKSSVTRAEVQNALGVSQATAISLLRDMLNKCLLMTEGGGKNLKYKRNS
jgi:ATP-dependent DNA helicase RecG